VALAREGGWDMTTKAHPQKPAVRSSASTLVAVGGLGGLAWAAGLRGFMAELAGSESTVHWYGTFVQVLLPGAMMGMLLGWAEYLRRTGGRPRWRWLACAPLTFVFFILVSPDMINGLLAGEVPFSDGLGGGAVAIPVFGMAGGYALSERGPLWGRLAAGTVAVVPIPGWAIASPLMGEEFAWTTARGAWIAALFYSSILVLQVACTIPHRPVAAASPVMGEASRAEGSMSPG